MPKKHMKKTLNIPKVIQFSVCVALLQPHESPRPDSVHQLPQGQPRPSKVG